jgi:hypothetical protein
MPSIQSESSKFEGLFQPRGPLEYIGWAFLAWFVMSPLQDMLKEIVPQRVIRPLSIFVFATIFIVWFFRNRSRAKRLAKQVAFQPTREPPTPARGLILLLSPYDPRNPDLRKEEVLGPLIDKIKNAAPEQLTNEYFDNINLLRSNLRPQIEAVQYHFQPGRLRDVWLVTSRSYTSDNGILVQGSEEAASILDKFLRWKYAELLTVRRGPEFSAKEWDYKGLSDIGEKIFRESDYKDELLLADITGGTKMMSVALALSCIPPGRRMQYVYSERDWQGNPLERGAIDPVVIDIDPILYAQTR